MTACNSLSTLDVLPARTFHPTPRSSFSPQEALIFLQKCVNFKQIKQIHAKIIHNTLHHDQVIVARLIRLCSSYRELDYAALVFQHADNPSTFVWNLLIRTHTVNDCPHRAIQFYNLMIFRGVSADKFTFPFVMKACLAISSVEKAREVYGAAVKSGFHGDVYLDNVLIDLYMKCGAIDDALKVFHKMRHKSVVSWTTVLAGLVLNGRMDIAQKVFDRMPTRNVVSWTAMINGYVKSGKPETAFELCTAMRRANVSPNEYTLVALLTASAELESLELGRWVHQFAIKNGFEIGAFLGTSLIDMYSKCGSLECAKRVFAEMESKSVATWNAMITSLGVHGRGEEAIAVFEEMERRDVQPDAITFAGVLSACMQIGEIDKGRRYLYYMVQRYGIEPSFEHYVCLFEMYLAKLLDLESSDRPSS
ncbi:pentatricopeptide repeat-containing protein At3g26630, chloroplastic [Salvia miltiorrhiza]|uniref:pentatricopeptide repeat-containing protein At3g26630, chloroplastic n=1 Tax=Salvia miltiorrhiza TaxID=226208 RepID=UPI0025ABBCAC|nr:pentatricopeptide repeat-containing protein At3g26630, chloroplastic [Salvia miltiorrhiza]